MGTNPCFDPFLIIWGLEVSVGFWGRNPTGVMLVLADIPPHFNVGNLPSQNIGNNSDIRDEDKQQHQAVVPQPAIV
eukprot:2454517-Amphidinium_carterae.1